MSKARASISFVKLPKPCLGGCLHLLVWVTVLASTVVRIAVFACACLLLSGHIFPANAQTIVDLSITNQTIRGFGGASVWLGAMTDSEMDTLFLNTDSNHLGFTINRCRIDPTTNWTQEISNAQKAAARGAIVFATPWTPPASMKDTNSVIGGSLLMNQYGAYASYLQSFVNTMAANGVSLYAISMQNEPDANVNYESCSWTPTQMLNFTKTNAGTITGTKFIMPESEGFNHAYSDPTLNDSTAASHVAIVAGHIYCGGACISPYPQAVSLGKDVWMTEHLENDTNLAGAISTGLEITECLAVANFNAYVTWWWRRYYSVLDDTAGPTYDTITKRGYVMGQFSKFIRPGCVRVNSTYNTDTNIYTSAYKSGSNVVIVAVNMDTNAISEQFSITGGAVSSVTPYRTSGAENISTLPAIAVVAGAFTTSLPGQSVTTFVGTTGEGTPPPAPTGLSAAAAGSSQINLSWNASSGATSYNVKRSTTSSGPYTNVASSALTNYSDGNLSAVTTYYYVVSAVNTGGESTNSAEANATTLFSPTIEPVADAYVRDGSYTNTNFGTDTNLAVKADTAGFNRISFLRFDVHALTNAQSVKLKLVPNTVGATTATFAYEWVTNDTWSETGITWNNMPPGSGLVFTNITGYSVGAPVVIDVTSKVVSQAAADGYFSVRITSLVTNSTANVWFCSREYPSNSWHPVLDYTFSNSPPTLAAVANQTINPGVTLLVTNTASDPDLPAESLMFTLLTSPTNATLTTLNPTNARVSWRPLISQAGSTNTFQVKVADNDSPSLSATNSYVVTVNPASQPVISSFNFGGGHVNLTGTGLLGPDYTLLTSTNLTNWQSLFTTNPAAMPVTFTDTNHGDATRFYRLQLGP